MTKRLIVAVAALTLGGCAGEAVRQAETGPVIMGSADRGAMLVQQKCAGCHAVDRTGDSPVATSTATRDRARAGLLACRGDLASARALVGGTLLRRLRRTVGRSAPATMEVSESADWRRPAGSAGSSASMD